MGESSRTISRKIVVKKSTIRLCLLLVLFRVALDVAYRYAISPIYAYAGFTVSIDSWTLIESYVLTFLVGIMSPSAIVKPSDFLVWMFSVGTMIPTLSYYGMHSGPRVFMYWVCFSFLIVVITSRLPNVRIPTLKQGRKIGVFAMIVTTFIVALSLIAKGGLKHFNLAFSKVYDHRRDVGVLISTGLWGYLNNWVFKVINPALISWALWRKRYRLILVFVGLQILFFGISSNKAVLFYPVLIAAVYIFARKRYTLEYLTCGLIIVVLVSSLVSLVLHFNWPLSLFVRRTFFLPAQLNFVYYDLFSDIGYVYLSNSILSGLIDYPFSQAPQVLVGQYCPGQAADAWVNNGFVATGYMHFGYAGMLVFAIIVGLLLASVDSLTADRLPLWLGISIVIVPFRALFISADLFTALMTHGIIVALVVMLVIGIKQTHEPV
ncbi:MAG TPA: hypothetical protein GXX70_09735 [Tepidimicrobium sp.]|nr:hypothetical protein [Tepidimicrobium sp.]